jgi:hypothetical protein
VSALSRHPHDERARRTGRFTKSPACDGCGKPCGTAYYTDDEVCRGSDGPGFYLCDRKRCAAAREGKSAEERRVLYTTQRARNESKEIDASPLDLAARRS